MSAPIRRDGPYYEDLEVGAVYQNPLGRTLTDADNTWFTLLTMNTNQAHFNADFATHTEFGRPIINSGLTVAVLLGLTVADVSQNAIANLGWEQIKLLHPFFAGDTMYAESKVLSMRPSTSRPNGGIVTVRSRAINQDGAVCISWRRTVLVQKRPSDLERARLVPKASTSIDLEDT